MTTTTDPDAYPAREEDVTAERLCRHLVKSARERTRRIDSLVPAVMDGPKDGPERRLFTAENAAHVNGWAVVFMLRSLLPEQADHMARALWREWADGTHLHEELHRWAREYGISPDPDRPRVGE